MTNEQIESCLWLFGCLVKCLFFILLIILGCCYITNFIEKFTISDFYALCCLVVVIVMFIPVYKFLDKVSIKILQRRIEKEQQKEKTKNKKKSNIINRVKAYKRLLTWRRIRKNKSFDNSFLNKGIYKR